MIRIFDVYIGRVLLSSIFMTALVLVSLSSIIKLVEQLRKIGTGDYDFAVALIFTILSAARDLEQLFPMACLIGALIGMGVLASQSELTAMRAAGMSKLSIIGSGLKSCILLIVIIMAFAEFVTPVAESKSKEIRTTALSSGSLISSAQRIWAKDRDNFVQIGQVVSQNEIANVSVYEFDNALELVRLDVAERALYRNGVWVLHDVQRLILEPEQVRREIIQATTWNTELTPEKLGIVAIKPEALSIRGLAEYLQYLESNGQETNRYELALYRKLFTPIAIIVMILMAMTFIFGPLRSVSTGARTMMGVLAGFTFFLANQLFGPLALVYGLPPALGAIAPSLLFGGASIAVLNRY